MGEIMKIADDNQLFVIEDNAQALGSSYQFKNGKSLKTGGIGHIGTTSFFHLKI